VDGDSVAAGDGFLECILLYRLPLLWHVGVETRHVNAERLLAKAGREGARGGYRLPVGDDPVCVNAKVQQLRSERANRRCLIGDPLATEVRHLRLLIGIRAELLHNRRHIQVGVSVGRCSLEKRTSICSGG